MKSPRKERTRSWRFAQQWRSLATALCLLAIVAGIPGLSRAMLSPLFSTIEGNETQTESPTEESAESNSIGVISWRVRELRVASSSDHPLTLTSAFRQAAGHRAESGDSARCRGAALQLALRC